MKAFLRWMALAGGLPMAVLLRTLLGSEVRDLLAPSLVLHVAAVLWSSAALLTTELVWRFAPESSSIAGVLMGLASLGVAIVWTVTTYVASTPGSPLARRLRMRWAVAVCQECERLMTNEPDNQLP